MKKPNNRLSIFWSSNSPWSTSGYGTQTAELVFDFAKRGYRTACGCFYGLEGGRIKIDGVTMYPKMASTWGEDMMIHHAKHFGADVSFSFQDIWTLDPEQLRQIKRWIPYVPIDHEPVPRPIFDRLKLAYRIVTYSKFGQQELEKRGLASTYIPHTVDTRVFKPMDKKACRRELDIPEDVYLFGMVAANKDNPPRKGFQQAIDAFAKFHAKHPNSAMYMSTLLSQPGGFDIQGYFNFLGLGNCLYFIDPYNQVFNVDRQTLAKIYNAFDCLVAPSLNEGFGIPIIEAQACGVPAIVNNCTAMPELIVPGKTGEICRTLPGADGKRFSPLGSYVGVPDTESLYEQMEKVFLYDREQVSAEAVEWITKNYDTRMVLETYWFPFLEKLEKEIHGPIVDIGQNG